MSKVPVQVQLAPLLARTASVTGDTEVSYGYRGIKVVNKITVNGSGNTVTVNIYGVDAYGNKYLLLASSALSAVATVVLTVHPAMTASTNVTANDVLPARFEVDCVLGNANSITFSTSYDLLP